MLIAPPLAASSLYEAGRQALVAGDSAEAVRLLGRAAALAPDSPGALRDLAAAHLAAGDPAGAVAALEAAYRLQPTSRLTRQQLALAYLDAGQIQRGLAIASQVGFEAEQLVGSIAARALARSDHRGAGDWLDEAARQGYALTPGLALLRVEAAVLAGDPEAQDWMTKARRLDGSLRLNRVRDGVQLPGAELRWMDRPADGLGLYGPPLTYSGGVAPQGWLWWSGRAGAFLWVDKPGRYTVSAHVRHSAPAPIELALGLNDRQYTRVSLGRGDESAETISFVADVGPGLLLLNLWFLNDGSADGRDRNAVVEWVEIRPTPEGNTTQ